MARIAFIGLGRMGAGMAARLLAAGHEIVVHNRTSERGDALLAAGARWGNTPAEAAADADAVFVMVSDDDASRAVWLGPDGVLAHARQQAFAIECSTLSHSWALELADACRAAGLRYLDCPVTGLPDAAAAGRLTLLVGATDDDLAAARDVLAPLADQIVHFGGVGTGTAYKLIVNLIGAVQIASVAEGLALAERVGLDLDQFAAVLATGQAASPQVVRNARRMAADAHDDVVFAGRLRRKDVDYARRLATELGAPAPFGRVAHDLLDDLIANGLGDLNESAIVELFRRPTDGRWPTTAEPAPDWALTQA